MRKSGRFQFLMEPVIRKKISFFTVKQTLMQDGIQGYLPYSPAIGRPKAFVVVSDFQNHRKFPKPHYILHY